MGRHITVETALRSHPKFKRLRRLAGLTERDTLGALTSFWMTVRDVSADGRIPSWDADDVDEAAGTPGICQHLVAVGFLERDEAHGLLCHDWMDHSGNQCKDADRKRVERAKKASASTERPRTVRGASAPEGKGREGEGRDRTGESEPTLLVSAPAPTAPKVDEWLDSFDPFWTAYPRKVAKPAALKAWKVIKPQTAAEWNRLMDGLDRWAAFWKAKAQEPSFIPHASTWLNQRRWEDRP